MPHKTWQSLERNYKAFLLLEKQVEGYQLFGRSPTNGSLDVMDQKFSHSENIITEKQISHNEKSNLTTQDPWQIAANPSPNSAQSLPQPSHPQPHGSDQTAGHPKYPPQTYHTQAPACTFFINCENWKGDRFRITDSDEHTPLYDVKLKLLKPQMTFTTTSAPTTPMATVIFHTFHTRIDAIVNDNPFTLSTRLAFKSVYSFSSPALQGRTLTWKSRNSSFDLVCVDEAGVAVARYVFSKWSVRKCGKLEVVEGGKAGDRAVVDEIVVTGCAFAYYMQMARGGV